MTFADDWRIELSARREQRYWEVLRREVLSVAVNDIDAIFKSVRIMRRGNGWQPSRIMEIAVAIQDVRELTYLLCAAPVPAIMKILALRKAASGRWDYPSEDHLGGISTTDLAKNILGLKSSCGYVRPIQERDPANESPCTWIVIETGVNAENMMRTEWACVDAEAGYCLNRLTFLKVGVQLIHVVYLSTVSGGSVRYDGEAVF